jgi:hypothetical protein
MRKVAGEVLRQWRCVSGATKCCQSFNVDDDGDYADDPSDPNQPFQQCLDQAKTKPLQMNKAPFRLLAIVNRLDLRKNMFFGEGKAGELRFVWSVLDLEQKTSDKGACGGFEDIARGREPGITSIGPADSPGINTVILEYAVDKKTTTDVKAWASKWAGLNSHSFTSTTYLSTLQDITEAVVVAGKGGSKRPNSSELIRIRTNDSQDDNNWQLREFEIDPATHLFRATTIKNTPSSLFQDGDQFAPPFDFTDAQVLTDWINQNEQEIIDERHNVPTFVDRNEEPFLGGETTHFGNNGLNGTWAIAAAQSGLIHSSEARRTFSFNTCNGCHGAETNTDFSHIAPRPYGQEAQLSCFLTGCTVDDPARLAPPRDYHAFSDRVVDMQSALTLRSLSGLAFVPTSRVH